MYGAKAAAQPSSQPYGVSGCEGDGEDEEEAEGNGEDKGNPSQGGPGTARSGAEKKGEGQPVATEVRTMLFRMWAAPTAMTVINVLTSWFLELGTP